jgi:hypothetical protein
MYPRKDKIDAFGELSTNVTGLLATQKGNTTPFKLHSHSAPQFYVTGNQAPTDPKVRKLEQDVAGLTANNPFSGYPQEKITNYLADPVEQGILHIVNADPARTPTFTLFAKPDYFLSSGAADCSKPCVHVDPGFAYNHGDDAAEINTDPRHRPSSDPGCPGTDPGGRPAGPGRAISLLAISQLLAFGDQARPDTLAIGKLPGEEVRRHGPLGA